jgi:hypothetical protein
LSIAENAPLRCVVPDGCVDPGREQGEGGSCADQILPDRDMRRRPARRLLVNNHPLKRNGNGGAFTVAAAHSTGVEPIDRNAIAVFVSAAAGSLV